MRDLKTEIREEAMRRLEKVEDLFSNGATVPQEIMALYGLLVAIAAASIDRYFDNFGHREIDPGDINDAKQDLSWSPLTDFEREVCELINEKCREREHGMRNHQKSIVGLRALG